MNPKNSSTLHRWTELTKWPSDETCHHCTPPTASTVPDRITTAKAVNVSTPKT